MAAPLDIAMPEDLDLDSNYTLRVTALSPADGSLVSGVTIGTVVLTATLPEGVNAGDFSTGSWFLVPGPEG